MSPDEIVQKYFTYTGRPEVGREVLEALIRHMGGKSHFHNGNLYVNRGYHDTAKSLREILGMTSEDFFIFWTSEV